MSVELADPTLPLIRIGYRGPVILSPSRWVWFTGKVAIGLKHTRPTFYVEQQSERDAEHLQCLLLRSA